LQPHPEPSLEVVKCFSGSSLNILRAFRLDVFESFLVVQGRVL
jgi:hypothetical protein